MSKSHSRRRFLHGSAPEARAVEPSPTLVDVTTHILPSIQAEREYPAVSVVLAVAGPRFGLDDRTRGEGLVSEAARRLAHELSPSAVEAMVDPLRRTLAELVGARVEGGVALLRAVGELHAFRLTVTPTERVVIDPTFATRDLVRSVASSDRRPGDVLDQLANADRAGRAERGIDATWTVLRQSSSLHLIVEDGFAFAAYLASDGTHVIPAAVPETPSATDDLVDEMIELAMAKGGTVSFVAPGSLAGDGVAVIRNHRSHSAS